MRNYMEAKSASRSEEYAECTIKFEKKEHDQENVMLVIERCPNGCMSEWVKGKIFKEPFAWWVVRVYVTNKNDGLCYGKYNPQEKREVLRDNKGKIWLSHNIINFDWVLPATEENKNKIIREVSRLAFGN